MNFRVGACALLVCLAGCSAEAPNARMSAQTGKAATQLAGQKLRTVQMDRSAAQSIANAPDRGQLIDYKNKGAAIKREGAYTWYPVAISEAHALKAVVTGEMTIPSPDGSQVKLKYERHEEQTDGNWTWIGRVVGGDQNQEAILTFGEKAVYGSIPQSSGAPLSLQTRSGALYAVQTDLSKVKNPNTAATDMMVPPAMALRQTLMASAKAQVSQAADVSTKASTPSTTVDVAIGYTQGVATLRGGQSGAVTRLVFLIAVGNEAYQNSLITGALRLVSAVQVDYADATTNQSALEDLTGIRNDVQIQVPAGLAPLRTAREQYGADVAVLVRRFQTPENDGCGIAWLNGAGQTEINPTIDDDYAFAVVSDGDDKGTDGNNYFCAPETLVHELGHVMGSAHDQENSKTSTGALLYGRYPYSFGLKTTAANGNFYTIMAYGANNQNFYRTFSNPLVTKCGPSGAANLSCGVANVADNARSLNQTIPVVAAFRATIVPYVSGVPNDFDGDKKSDIYWRNTTTGVNDLWVMNGSKLSAAYPVHSEPNQAWAVLGSGDFNGDGKADVLWRNSTSGQVYIHFMDGLSVLPSSGNSLVVADQNLKVVAIADFDGDGFSDIYWRHSTTGSNTLWLMNGLTPKSNTVVYAEPNLAWKIVGAGDFNGDGSADLFWRNTSTGDNYVQFMKGSVVQATSALTDRVAEQAFQVVAIRDFNNDGKADLYWRNMTTGQNWMWTMDGLRPTKVTYVHYEPNQAWQIVNSGDYNGDGFMDIFWRNSTTGQTYVHLLQNTTVLAASGMSTAVPNLAWQVTGR